MRRLRSVLAGGAAATVLAATAGHAAIVSQYYSPYPHNIGGPSDIFYAASLGPMPVFVRGSPFAGDPGHDGLVAAFQRHTSVPLLRFVPVAAPGNIGYRIVVAFGDFVPGVNYCDGRPDFPVSGSPPGQTRMAVSFCLNTSLYAQALVTGGAAYSPADPAFSDMVGSLLPVLLR